MGSFRARLVALHLAVVAVTTVALGAGATVVSREALYAATARRLEAEARLVAAALPAAPGDLRSFVRRLGGRLDERITLIADDGRVLGDSQLDPGLLDNHGHRPEVAAARAAGVGVFRRHSDSVGTSLFYVALRVDRAAPPGPAAAAAGPPAAAAGESHGVRFVRLALTLERVEAPLLRLRGMLAAGLLLGGALGVAAALLAARALRQRAAALAAFADEVARGGPDPQARPRATRPHDDEFGVVERHLEATAADLSTYVAALAEQRRRVEAIIGSMDEGLIVVTVAGEVLLMNGVAERLLDVQPDTWRGRSLLELTRHPDLHAILERASAEGRSDGEVRFTAPREIDLAVSVAPLRGAGQADPLLGRGGRGDRGGAARQETLGYVVVLRDVTRLRKLERVRTDFVANVSHELKTPLAAIRAALETLHDWALEDPAGARRYVAICLSHSERLQRLIDDLLALSDIELRQVRLSPQRIDLGGAVDETFELLSAKAQAREVALVKAIPPGFPPLLVDRNRLIQILLNLVDNAVKYTPKGGTVTVSGETRPEGLGTVVVADTGIGIPRADLPRLGERFYRVDKGRSRDAGGTGLGLAIVKHLTQIHGGRLEIASEVGRGTTVRVVLPTAAPGTLPVGADRAAW